jgi:hypothetical protein
MTDGLLIRSLSRADRAALAFGFRRLGRQSRYQRFPSCRPTLSARELASLTAIDDWHHEGLIAYSPPPRAPIGLAYYVRSPQFDLAEVAISAVDEIQRR